MSQLELCRRACDAWNGPRQDSNTPPWRVIVLSPSYSLCGVHAPVRPMQLPKEVISGGEFCACLQTVVSVGG